MIEFPKTAKVLVILNKLGKTGIPNLLFYYEKEFPNDYMYHKYMVQILDYSFQRLRVSKLYKGRKRWWGNHPQIYEITEKGRYYLNQHNLL